MKKFLILVSAIIYLSILIKPSHVLAQYITYPIPALGNCQNAGECFYYCQIPSHTPACWAYGEYVLKPDVLGEQTVSPEEEAKTHGITFPVAELGNCATPQDCFAYCDKPDNQNTCFAFAKQKNLLKESDVNLPPPSEILTSAKTELGCTSRESCKTLCENSQNIEKCRNFAQKHKLNRPSENNQNQGPPPEEILKKAQIQLGCSSEKECQSFCTDPSNSSKCLEFARNNQLLDPQKEQEIEKLETKKIKMMDDAKKDLGCDSRESCSAFCSQPQNSQKCAQLYKKQTHEEDNQPKSQNTKPCASDEECRNYCQSHPGECPGFQDKKNGELKSTSSIPKKSAGQSSGDFIGPTGCKTQGECQDYCQKHPKECPNFPISTPTQNISEQKNPSQTGGDQKSQFTPAQIKDSGSSSVNNKFNDSSKPSKPEFEKH